MTSPSETVPEAARPPLLAVTRGAPGPEELTALTLALLARARAAPPAPQPPARPGTLWRPLGGYRPAGSWAVR